jgi:DNA-binding CsgD family transcriptional regulator
VSRTELDPLRRAARALAEQTGSGVPRRALVELAAGSVEEVTVYAGDPPLAVVRPAAPGSGERWSGLTPREREVAALVAEGLSNREVAERLVISLATVKDHVHSILVKADLPRRSALAAAWRAG